MDIDKLKAGSTDIRNLSNAVDNDVVKKTVYGEFVTNFNAIDTSQSVKKTGYNTKNEEGKDKIPNDDNYVTNLEFNKFSSAILDEEMKKSKSSN